MARFKQVPQHYVLDKVMEYWLNMVRNYREDVHDNDFFDILRRSYSHERAIRLVESAYTKDELKKMEKARRRWSRLDLPDGLECVFTALWNNAPSRRTADRRLSSASRREGLNHEIDERPERCGVRRDRCWKADWRMT